MSCVSDAADLSWVVSVTLRIQLYNLCKKKLSGVIDNAERQWTKKVDFKIEYLREYEVICKKALTRVSGAQMELFDKKSLKG
jgi:hypothetical protein